MKKEWFVHLSEFHVYQDEDRVHTPFKTIEQRDKIGYLHNNGIRSNNARFWDGGLLQSLCKNRNKDCETNKAYQQAFRSSWGLANYYINLPYKYLFYFAENTVRPEDGGFPLRVVLNVTDDYN